MVQIYKRQTTILSHTMRILQSKSIANQVDEILLERIRDGMYLPGSRIPSESELSDELHLPNWQPMDLFFVNKGMALTLMSMFIKPALTLEICGTWRS